MLHPTLSPARAKSAALFCVVFCNIKRTTERLVFENRRARQITFFQSPLDSQSSIMTGPRERKGRWSAFGESSMIAVTRRKTGAVWRQLSRPNHLRRRPRVNPASVGAAFSAALILDAISSRTAQDVIHRGQDELAATIMCLYSGGAIIRSGLGRSWSAGKNKPSSGVRSPVGGNAA